jgi:hypothetical protein
MSNPGRQETEAFWIEKLEEANRKYQSATARYRRLLQEKVEAPSPSSGGTLEQARQAESEALSEYTRVLKIFTDLTVNGTIPKEQPTRTADGGAR